MAGQPGRARGLAQPGRLSAPGKVEVGVRGEGVLRGRGLETIGRRWAGVGGLSVTKDPKPQGLGRVGGSQAGQDSCPFGQSSLRASVSSPVTWAWREEKIKWHMEGPRTVPGPEGGSIISVSLRGTGNLPAIPSAAGDSEWPAQGGEGSPDCVLPCGAVFLLRLALAALGVGVAELSS